MPPMITRHNPTQLHNPPGYHHVTVVESGRFAFRAGQCPLDAFGALVGTGDIDLQIDQVAANAAAVLAAVGARPAMSAVCAKLTAKMSHQQWRDWV
jgi:enamine deaminase RidA (YjgF/YER057c/UK114 family)